MLGSIIAITISVSNLDVVENSYSNTLGYYTVESGEISAQLSNLWGASKVVGRPYILMRPESGADVFFRFIESDTLEVKHTLDTFGWNAAELHVKNVDEIPKRLEGTKFEIISMPRSLSTTDDIKAMQVFGPSKELIYFTTVKNPDFGLGMAKSFIDRVFIVINAGQSMKSHFDFYQKKLGLEISEPQPVRMSALNRILGLDPEFRHPLSTANIGEGFVIELDQYPEGTVARKVIDGDIPGGIGMVSFQVDNLDNFGLSEDTIVIRPDGKVYSGSRSAVIVGPNGEWLELIENSL